MEFVFGWLPTARKRVIKSQAMDQEPNHTPDNPPKPVIPPPDLSRPPPPPPSPLEGMPKSSPPPLASAGKSAAKVNLAGLREEGTAPAKGLASLNIRITAAAIDMVVALGISVGLVLILPAFAGKLAGLIGIAYLVLRDSLAFLGGQSVGKKAMKLKAVTLDGKSLVSNWEAALVRNGVLIIPFFGLVELFILLNREDKPERGRRLGDEWAKTQVIVEPRPLVSEEPG